MLHICICDDDAAARAQLEELVGQYFNNRAFLLTTHSSYTDFLTAKQHLDLLLMDIDLGDGSGIELAKGAKHADSGSSLKDSINTVFVNGYYDFHTGTIFTPYLGLGIGTAWVDSKGDVNGHGAGSNTETNFAWNVGAGVGIELDYNLSLDLNYRYAGFGTARTGVSSHGVADGSLRTHQVLAGVRYTF